MNKKKWIIIIGLFVLLNLWWWNYGFVMYYNYLSNPPIWGYTPNEKILFDSLQKRCNCELARSPRAEFELKRQKNMENKYSIFFWDLPLHNFSNEDSLRIVAFNVAQRAYLNLDESKKDIFDTYLIVFRGKDEGHFEVEFPVEELKK